jgi:hypothetical protein
MDHEGIRASVRHGVDGLLQIDQPGDRPDRHPMIHWDDHRLPGLPVHNPFHANPLPNHNLFLLSTKIKKAVRGISSTALKNKKAVGHSNLPTASTG